MTRRLRWELAILLGCTALSRHVLMTPARRTRSDQSLPSLRFPRWPLVAVGAALGLAFWPSRRATYRGKSVVITGGSRGLGLDLARLLVQEGAKVTLVARDPDELDHAKHELEPLTRRHGGDIFWVNCDVTASDHLDTAFAEARARFGAIDMLINNAGIITVGPFETLDKQDFESQMNVHLNALIQATRLIRPYFHMQGEGRIINITSIGGKIPVPHMSSYCASKFAAAGFSEAVRGELRQENIFVTTAYPGLMRTGSPIQGVFKGDREKEFAWFAFGDNTPGLSISAERAARRILEAARDKQASVIVGIPAKTGALFHSLLPETFAMFSSLMSRARPSGPSHEQRTGATSQDPHDPKKYLSAVFHS